MLCYSQIKNENNEIINCSKIEIFDGRCQGNWQIKNHIASGFYGKVYSICNSSLLKKKMSKRKLHFN